MTNGDPGRPRPVDTIYREVRDTVPVGYAKADWHVAVDSLVERVRANAIDRIRNAAQRLAKPMTSRARMPQPPHEAAIPLSDLEDLLEHEKRRTDLP